MADDERNGVGDLTRAIVPDDLVRRLDLVRRVCAEVLGADELTATDNLIRHGADSITMLRIVVRARRAGLLIDLRTALSSPTVLAMAQSCVESPPGPQPAARDAGVPELALTQAQRLFLDVFEHPQEQVIQLLLEVADDVTAEVAALALRTVADRHDVFRVSFHADGGRWRQVLAGPETTLELEVRDEAHGTAPDEDIPRRGLSVPIGTPPLARATFYLRREARSLLHLTMNHLIIDAMAIEILLDDLHAAVEFHLGRRPRPGPVAGFAAWCRWLERRGSIDAAGTADAWLRYLAGARVPTPVDHVQGENRLENTLRAGITLPAPATERLLSRVAEEPGLSTEGCVLAALVHGYTRVFDVPSMTTLVSRNSRKPVDDAPDPSIIVGWLVHHFPVSITAPTDGEPADSFAEKACVTLAAVPDDGLTYGLIVDDDPKTPAGRRLQRVQPDVTFIFHGVHGEWDGPGPLLREVAMPDGPRRLARGRRTVLFQITAHVADDGLHVGVRYSVNHHRTATVERLLDEVHRFLTAISTVNQCG